ncbi:hypothetical protein [cyanobacterium endosymbiont of Rhopalodia gibberula]|nr:hypothetical protein [cyanobacterium endosymbiont of Rhopalodia gibberula]
MVTVINGLTELVALTKERNWLSLEQTFGMLIMVPSFSSSLMLMPLISLA